MQVAATSSLCGGDGGAVILPLAEEVAATGAPEGFLLAGNEVGGIAAPGAPNGPLLADGGFGRARVGGLVSVWSNSERSWNDGWVVAAGGTTEQKHVTGHFYDSVDGRERMKRINAECWARELRRRGARTRTLSRSRSRSPRSSQDSRGRVRFDHCVNVAAPGAADRAQQALAIAESVIARFAGGRPYYFGVCLNMTDRWLLGRYPDRHVDRYLTAFALVRAPSAICRRLEAQLIREHRHNGLCVNRASGGGGLADGHPVAFLYVCVGGGAATGAEARDSRARDFSGVANGHCCVATWGIVRIAIDIERIDDGDLPTAGGLPNPRLVVGAIEWTIAKPGS